MRAPFYGLRGRRSRGPAANGSRPERGPRRRDEQEYEQADLSGPDAWQDDSPATGRARNHNSADRHDDTTKNGQEEPHGRRRRGPGVRLHRRPDHET
jgi:hypothetical protein